MSPLAAGLPLVARILLAGLLAGALGAAAARVPRLLAARGAGAAALRWARDAVLLATVAWSFLLALLSASRAAPEPLAAWARAVVHALEQ